MEPVRKGNQRTGQKVMLITDFWPTRVTVYSWASDLMLKRLKQGGSNLQQLNGPGYSEGSFAKLRCIAQERNPAAEEISPGTSLLGARTLLVAPGLTTSNKKLLGTKGIATSNKDATFSTAIQYSTFDSTKTSDF